MRISIFKSLVIIFFLVCSFALQVYPENYEVFNGYAIKQVDIQGWPEGLDKKILPERIKSGEIFEVAYLLNDISAILALGVIEDVNVKIVQAQGFKEINIGFEFVANQRIKNIDFNNVTIYSKDKLLAIIDSRPGSILDYTKISNDIGAIEALYHQEGYLLAKVVNVSFINEHQALMFYLEEGIINDIQVNGLEQINPQLLYREMSLSPEKPFNMEKLQEDRKNILGLGFFSRIGTPRVKPSDFSANKVDILYDVQERKINNLQLGFEQLPNSRYSFTTRLIFPNFRNTGEAISFKAQLLLQEKLDNYSYYFKYTDPWFSNRKLPFNLILWHQINDEKVLNLATIPVQRNGFDVNWELPLPNSFKLIVGYGHETVLDTSQVYNNYFTNSLRAQVYRNRVDDIKKPTLGTMFFAEAEKGKDFFGLVDLGGVEYSKYKMEGSFFRPLKDNLVLGVHAEFGVMQYQSGVQFFEQDVFILGGAYSLRGYRDSYADSTNARTGRKMAQLNAELRYYLFDWWEVALFADAGIADDKDLAGADVLYGRGLGCRFYTPIAPIRFDLAWNKTNDFLFHFALGQLF